MKSLTWNQVNAWRLAQHGLDPRLKRESFVEVTSRLYGIHAQVMSATPKPFWHIARSSDWRKLRPDSLNLVGARRRLARTQHAASLLIEMA